jgi:hypothetical protein
MDYAMAQWSYRAIWMPKMQNNIFYRFGNICAAGLGKDRCLGASKY